MLCVICFVQKNGVDLFRRLEPYFTSLRSGLRGLFMLGNSTERFRWKMLPAAAALLLGVWVTDSAFAAPVPDSLGPSIGTLNFTLTTDPTGASTNPAGGGPFLLTLSSPNPGTLLSSRGIPSSVLSWCVETSQSVSVGVLNTAVELHTQAASKIGALVSAGLKWLNITGSAIVYT